MLATQPLALRVAGDERLELADEGVVGAGGEVGVDAVLQAREPQLLEVDALDGGERLGELGQRRAAPQHERLAKARRRRGGVAAGQQGAALVVHAPEADDVEGLRLELDRVARRPGHQHRRGQHLAELGDVDLHHLDRRLGGLLAPEVLDQALDAHGAVGVQEQPGQKRALLAPAQEEGRRAVADLERSEQPELHGHAQRYQRVRARPRAYSRATSLLPQRNRHAG